MRTTAIVPNHFSVFQRQLISELYQIGETMRSITLGDRKVYGCDCCTEPYISNGMKMIDWERDDLHGEKKHRVPMYCPHDICPYKELEQFGSYENYDQIAKNNCKNLLKFLFRKGAENEEK